MTFWVPDDFPDVDLDLVIPHSAFFLVGLVIAVVIFIREYISLLASSPS